MARALVESLGIPEATLAKHTRWPCGQSSGDDRLASRVPSRALLLISLTPRPQIVGCGTCASSEVSRDPWEW